MQIVKETREVKQPYKAKEKLNSKQILKHMVILISLFEKVPIQNRLYMCLTGGSGLSVLNWIVMTVTLF